MPERAVLGESASGILCLNSVLMFSILLVEARIALAEACLRVAAAIEAHNPAAEAHNAAAEAHSPAVKELAVFSRRAQEGDGKWQSWAETGAGIAM